jgi:predicted nucleotidyltransferase component of viral defense system
MKPSTPRNLATSVADRLLDRSRRIGEDYQFLLMRYGLERLMYRLSQSEHAGEFVMKGAMLFLVWTGDSYRQTKDVDLLVVKSGSAAHFKKVFRDLCNVTVADDALVFLAESVRAAEIRENAAYQGVRVNLEVRLGRARIPLQVDIGFGDAVTPKAAKAEFPTLLEFPAPQLSMYPKETVVAEKFEAMVKLGILNSRMKDYYDLWVLAREFEFNGETLSAAIRATFRRRKTALAGEVPLALTAGFSGDPTKRRQWQAFVRKGRFKLVEKDLEKVVLAVSEFVMPAAITASEHRTFKAHWSKGGPWKRAD